MPTQSSQDQLEKAVRSLERTIEDLPHRYSHVFYPAKHLFYTFIKGIAYGLGFLVALAVIVPIIIALLRTVNWVPIVGKFLSEVATQMEQVSNTGR